MKSKNIAETIEEFLNPMMEEHAFELVEVDFAKEGSNWYLRVYLDKEGGITIEDCELVSRGLEKIMDEHDPIEQPYILEVSSPGIDRALKTEKDFKKYAGRTVELRLFKPIDSRKEFQGTLVGLIDGAIVITEEGQELTFPKKSVSNCKLSVVF